MDRVLVTGMEFYGYHGVLAEEQRLGQRFVIDVELGVDLAPAGISDQLEDTVNYVEVYRIVKKLVEDSRFQLIEALAESIAGELLRCVSVKEVLVRVHKPGAPVPGIFGSVSVEIKRAAGGQAAAEQQP